MKYTVKPAELNDKIIIRSLLHPYLSEIAEFDKISPARLNESGEYDYPYLDNYWIEKDRYPYLFYWNEEVAGFALVRREGDYCEMAEFYVLPEFRRRGLGIICATDAIRRHAGEWNIEFSKQNQVGRQFWKKLVCKLATGDIKEGQVGVGRDYFQFSV